MTPPEDSHAFTIRLPTDLYEKLRKAAFDQHTSMNALIIEAIRRQQA
jgi:predicted HicB family RNase H-like nuclease